MTTKPRRPEGERPRDEFGRPLPWDAESKLALLDYDSFSVEKNHDLAIDYFNEGQYFPAHEAWEGAWRKAHNTPDEEFFKGLAQVGAGYTHIQRGNAYGAHMLITRGVERMRPYGPAHRGIDVERFALDALETARALQVDAQQRQPPADVLFPKVERVG